MKLNLKLSAEIEGVLRRRAAAAGQDVETFVATVVTEELTDDMEPAVSIPSGQSPEEKVRKLREIIERLGIRNGKFDDSRESIYAGRGE